MRIQTLIVAMNQRDGSLVERMNVQTDAIVGNQCDSDGDVAFRWNGHDVIYLNRSERGVGRNRNLVLSHLTADICVLADDDLHFVDGYPKLVCEAFAACPDADILVFNLIEKRPTRKVNASYRRIRWYAYGSYGAPRLAARKDALLRAGVSFSLDFGGGARYGSGEDTIFLHDCLRHGLKIFTAPLALAEIDQDAPSTHFTGFDRMFFFDKGAAYACLHPVLHPLFTLAYLLRHRGEHRDAMSLSKSWGAMASGALDYLGHSGSRHEI